MFLIHFYIILPHFILFTNKQIKKATVVFTPEILGRNASIKENVNNIDLNYKDFYKNIDNGILLIRMPTYSISWHSLYFPLPLDLSRLRVVFDINFNIDIFYNANLWYNIIITWHWRF